MKKKRAILVKVREQKQEQEQDDCFSLPNDGRSFLFIRILEPLSLQDHSSAEENQSNSSPAVARITKNNVPNAKAQLVTRAKVKNNTHISKDTKLVNSRANLLPRPRAVLSSPDNDGMIGNMNKFDKERSSSLKKLNPEKKVTAQTAAMPSPVKGFTARSPLGARRGSRDGSFDDKSGLTQSKYSKPVVPRRKTSLKKEIKSSSTGI